MSMFLAIFVADVYRDKVDSVWSSRLETSTTIRSMLSVSGDSLLVRYER